jgi:hypothetical protein
MNGADKIAFLGNYVYILYVAEMARDSGLLLSLASRPPRKMQV